MAVRSAFASVFGSFPPLVYMWIGLGISASILTFISILAPGWIPIFVPGLAVTTETGVQSIQIWEGWVFAGLAVISFLIFWKVK